MKRPPQAETPETICRRFGSVCKEQLRGVMIAVKQHKKCKRLKSSADAPGCFAENIGISFALNAELVGAMRAIEIAFEKGWHMLWLECDSSLVVQAFDNLSLVPWQLRKDGRIASLCFPI